MKYNGKTNLFVTYQWNEAREDAILVSRDYPTFDEAYRALQEVMPQEYCWDDGNNPDEWADDLAAGDPDVFTSWNAEVSPTANVLAYLRPVLDEEGGDHE